jgi:hypothetical protein
MFVRWLPAVVLALSGCAPAQPQPGGGPDSARSSAVPSTAHASPSVSVVSSRTAAAPTATASTATASAATAVVAAASASASATVRAAPHGPRPVSLARARKLLFGAEAPADDVCADGDAGARILCLIDRRYDDDAKTRALARSLYQRVGIVAGVERPHTMDGGWRGMIRLVPERPVGRHRRHLAWIAEATEDFERFFRELPTAGRPTGYRWQPIELRFMRSVGRTTPSAYATDWSIAYNVSGSLHRNADAVRETLFHEIFHLNDRAHGEWSQRALTRLHRSIRSRCTSKSRRLSTPCLTPYTPNRTMVRGGTYYAFQPGNGVWEYAAELAIRYYREHRSRQLGRRPPKPFKCGPPENAEAWTLLVDEFFAGVDQVPACAGARREPHKSSGGQSTP